MRVSIVCPKCQHERRPGDDACRRCGLLVSRWESFTDAVTPHPAIDAAWEALQSSWEDADAHRRFLELCAGADGLDLAAAHYRSRLRRAPPDSRARAGLDRALHLVETLHAARVDADRIKTPIWLRLAGYLAGGLVALVLVYGILLAIRGR
ncbi:MAG TPA: hypothetical protein VFF06_30120 [Polyangia bacterium]|nr:hypothetical protein [Polyangia bacterium]